MKEPAGGRVKSLSFHCQPDAWLSNDVTGNGSGFRHCISDLQGQHKAALGSQGALLVGGPDLVYLLEIQRGRRRLCQNSAGRWPAEIDLTLGKNLELCSKFVLAWSILPKLWSQVSIGKAFPSDANRFDFADIRKTRFLRYFLGNPSRRFTIIEQKMQSAVSLFLSGLPFSNFGHKLLSGSSFVSVATFTILLTYSKFELFTSSQLLPQPSQKNRFLKM